MLLNIQELVDVRAIAVHGVRRPSCWPARVNSYAILSYNTSDIVVYDDGRRIRMRDQESSRIRWQVARQSGHFRRIV